MRQAKFVGFQLHYFRGKPQRGSPPTLRFFNPNRIANAGLPPPTLLFNPNGICQRSSPPRTLLFNPNGVANAGFPPATLLFNPNGVANAGPHPQRSSSIPTGLRPPAQGREERATLGNHPATGIQPQRGCGGSTCAPKPIPHLGRNPVGVDGSPPAFPMVGRPGQPWAGGRNAVGVCVRYDVTIMFRTRNCVVQRGQGWPSNFRGVVSSPPGLGPRFGAQRHE